MQTPDDILFVVEIILMYVSGKQLFLKFVIKSHFLIIILELAMDTIMIGLRTY